MRVQVFIGESPLGEKERVMSENKTFMAGMTDIGSLLVDCTAMAPFLIDLPRGARVKLIASRPGFELVSAEIMANQATFGERAGVTQLDADNLAETNRRIAQIDEQLPAAQKLVEMLIETRAFLDDRRHRQVVAIANAVDSRAKMHGSDDLLARYERTREYRSEVGVKAWKTRRKNAGENVPADEPIGDLPDEPVRPPVTAEGQLTHA